MHVELCYVEGRLDQLERDVIRLDTNDERKVRWMCNVRPEDRISAEKLRIRLKLMSIKEYLQYRRLQWFGHLERTEETAWSSKCRTFKVSGSFARG